MSPEFPIRVITDDGECEVIDAPDVLMTTVDNLDSTDPSAKIWVRDAYDRTVRVRVRAGMVEVLELVDGTG
jgi:hypothetical protein